MKTGKSPWIDGFPVEYYKKYIDILASILLKVYMEAFETGTLPDTFSDALIYLIPKKDRDTSDPSDFRPVSLHSVDFKILTKTLASCLEKVLPDIINGDQLGFNKNRSSVDNMWRLMHLTYMIRFNLVPVASLSLDAEKAFDQVQWRFLMFRSVMLSLDLEMAFVIGWKYFILTREQLFSQTGWYQTFSAFLEGLDRAALSPHCFHNSIRTTGLQSQLKN